MALRIAAKRNSTGTQPTQLKLTGLVRHRPPNKHYSLTEIDKPEQARSYPNAPPGYPEFPVSLTTDQYGYRNLTQQKTYPVVAVGDSFTAGSHVSDEQGWTVLLSQQLGMPIYNLGVSGSGPDTYLNNFATLGKTFEPKLVFVMVYEGNDFRYSTNLPSPITTEATSTNTIKNDLTPNNINQPSVQVSESNIDSDQTTAKQASSIETSTASISPSKPKAQPAEAQKSHTNNAINWEKLAKASPVTKGLKRFSSEHMEQIGKQWPLPQYQQLQSWMPVKIESAENQHFYSFKPKRLLYLNISKQKFRQDYDWKVPEKMFNAFSYLAQQDDFRLIFVYAPSKPHVIMPLIENRIDAEQLLRFAKYKKDNLALTAAEFKQRLYANLNNQEAVFFDWCASNQVECISLTKPLQQATKNGEQTYFTYDQHWTPKGNQIAAQTIANYLQQSTNIAVNKP